MKKTLVSRLLLSGVVVIAPAAALWLRVRPIKAQQTPAVPDASQQVTGTLGSPSATTTISGEQLPPPPPKFEGVIKETYQDSTTWLPPRVVPPKGAPKVLLIPSTTPASASQATFGGVIPTPTLDKLAANGLRYTQMHNTALWSPIRAALTSS